MGALKGGSCYMGHVGLRSQASRGREKYFSELLLASPYARPGMPGE